MSCGVGRRCSLDPVLLWLWRRPETTAPIGPPAWEPPYAMGVALKETKKKCIVIGNSTALFFLSTLHACGIVEGARK